MALIRKVIINSLVLYLVAYWYPSIMLDSPVTAIAAACLLSLLSITIRPILLTISLPLSLISFGVFMAVIDAWMLQLVDLMLNGLYFPGFVTAFLTVLAMMAVNSLVGIISEQEAGVVSQQAK